MEVGEMISGEPRPDSDGLRLLVEWGAQQVVVEPGAPLHLGQAADTGLSVPGRHASKQHAVIALRGKRFLFEDCSTNGSFVQTEDELVVHVHRRSTPLWGAGWISLGEPLTETTAIRFRHV